MPALNRKAQTAATWLFPLAIVAAGAFLRFYAIGAKSLWLDETYTVNVINRSSSEMLEIVRSWDAHPPLYYTALHCWMQGSRSAVRARALSATLGVATLVAFYALARVLLPRAGALVATVLLAASAYQVYFAQEARLFALATFLVTVSWYFFVQLVAGKWLERWPLWLGLALANAAAVCTFYYCLFSLAAQLVALLLLWRGIGRKLIVPWIAWQLLPVTVFGLQVPVILARMKALGGLAPPVGLTALSGEGLLSTSAQFTCGFLGEMRGAGGPFLRACAAALGLLALLAGLAGVRGLRRATVLGLTWLVAPVVFLAVFPIRGHIYEPKHLIFAAPALALLPAIGVAAMRGKLKVLPALLSLLIVGANAASLARYYSRGVEKENWRGAIDDMAQEAEHNDLVFFNPPYTWHPYDYYYRPARYGGDWKVMKLYKAPQSGQPFRAGQLKLGRRIWLIEASSNVAIPNPDLARALGESDYKARFHKQYDGLVGSIHITLYDTPQTRGPKEADTP